MNRLSDFPDDEALSQVLFDLADRRRRGEPVDLEQVVQAEPQFATELRRLFPTIDALAELDRSGPQPSANHTEGAEPRATIGEYQIVREIGRGGMGIVYEARQMSLNRRVALKVLPFAAALDPRALARFRQESQAAAQLDHPHIVHVYGVGSDRGIHFYAMQYIEGQSLAQVIAEVTRAAQPVSCEAQDNFGFRISDLGNNGDFGFRISDLGINSNSGPGAPESDLGTTSVAQSLLLNPKSEIPFPKSSCASRLNAAAETVAIKKASLSTDRATKPGDFYRGVARLAIDAARALDYAHEHGIVHRDIKPGNLLVDDQGHVWITDFGLARIESAGNLTTTGDLMGTLRYSSPEQASGKRGLIDQRSDVYSLGATLYELLTLRPVFAADDRTELTWQIEQAEPVPLRQHVPQLPVELQTIVLKCLEKDPADRYATAQEVADDLGRYLANEPLTARPATYTERIRKCVRRHQMAVMAASVALSVLATLLPGSALWIISERAATTQQTKLAQLQEGKVRQDRYVDRINLAYKAWSRGDLIEAQRQLSECVPASGHEDLRGFEWSLLQGTLHATPRPWKQHQGEVYGAKFSPGGKLLATCGQDGVRIWSWPDGNEEKHLTGHSYDVNEIGFSPDGRLLASASDDGTVRIWETSTWQELQVLPQGGRVIAVEFSPDGQTLACGVREVLPADSKVHEDVRLWSVSTWEERGKMVGEAGEIQSLAWSPDGSLLATAMSPRHVSVWECNPARLRIEIPQLTGVGSVAFAHHRPLLAVGVGGQVMLYNIDSWRQQEILGGHPGGVGSVTFSADDESLLSTDGNGTSRLWQFTGVGDRMEEILVFRAGTRNWCARFTPDGRQIVTTGNDGAVRLWDIQHLPDRLRILGAYRAKYELAIEFMPDSTGLLIGDEALKLIDVETGHVRHTITKPGDLPISLKMSPDGQTLAAGDRTGKIVLWNSATWQQLETVQTDLKKVYSVSFVSGATGILLAGPPAQLFTTGETSHVDAAFPATVLENARYVEISPDGRTAARLGTLMVNPIALEIVDLPSGNRRAVVDGLQISVTYSPDGNLFASGGSDGIVRLWRTSDWDEPTYLVGHTAGIAALAISPDGRTLASAAVDGVVKLWHVATGRELLTLDGRAYKYECIRFSPDGKTLAASGIDLAHGRRFQVVVWRGEPRE